MSRRMGLILAISVVMLAWMGSASAETSGMAGGTAVESGQTVYFAIGEPGAQRLYSVPSEGGEPVLMDQALRLGELVSTPQGVYCLKDQGGFALVRADGQVLAEFGEAQRVSGLRYDHSAFYCLADGRLTRIHMDGAMEVLSETAMDEFVVKGGDVVYTASDDRKAYALDGEEKQAGRLHRLNLESGEDELLLDAGVENIKLLGDYLYFHNLEDSYFGMDEASGFLAGRLYRMRLSDGALQAVNCDADLEYFPTDSGLVVRTPWDIFRCSLSGGDVKQLLPVDQPMSLAISGGSAFAYMEEEGLLLRIPLDGSRAAVTAVVQENEEMEITAEAALDAANEAAGMGESEYIFPNSDREKLDRAQVEALEPALLGFARNEIYARHGYEFKNKQYADYFGGKSWYRPGGFSKSALNSIEWYNMDLITAVEEEKAPQNMPGTADYIFPHSDKHKLTREEIERVDPALWGYGRNEIYARHGYEFKKDQYAQYFMTRNWYRPGGFSTDSLNAVEWYNMELLRRMESEYSGE